MCLVADHSMEKLYITLNLFPKRLQLLRIWGQPLPSKFSLTQSNVPQHEDSSQHQLQKLVHTKKSCRISKLQAKG